LGSGTAARRRRPDEAETLVAVSARWKQCRGAPPAAASCSSTVEPSCVETRGGEAPTASFTLEREKEREEEEEEEREAREKASAGKVRRRVEGSLQWPLRRMSPCVVRLGPSA
jgi:hypothetical protein